MNINEIKKIKLADYLQSLGYTPVKQQGKSLWYKSPLRNETDACITCFQCCDDVRVALYHIIAESCL